MASRLQDVIQRGTAAARPLATAVAPGTLYYSTDTATTDRSGGGGGGASGRGIPGIDGLDGQDGIDGFPGTIGPVGNRGPTGNQGPPGQTSSFVIEQEEYIDEPPRPTPGIIAPAGPSGSITTAQKTRQIGLTVDGGGSVITTGQKGYKSFPVAGTITGVRLLADQSGSTVIDVWKDTFANYPPTVADTITASAKPTLSTQDHSEDVILSGWTTAVAAGDVFGFNVNSASTITRVTLELTIVVT